MPQIWPDTYVRGQNLLFSSTFEDAQGLPVDPTTAFVAITYPVGGGQVGSQQIALVSNGNSPPQYEGTWNSKVAQPGVVSWFIYVSEPTPEIAKQGKFFLAANSANLEAI